MGKLDRTMMLLSITITCLIVLGTAELLKLETTSIAGFLGFAVFGIFTIISVFREDGRG